MQIVKFYVYTFCVLSVFAICGIVWKMSYSLQNLKSMAKVHSPMQTYPIDTLDFSDYQQLVNLKNFTFTIINDCGNSSLLLLVLIHSHPNNFDKRDAIRSTWGQNKKIIKTVFMVALIEDENIKKRLEEENKKYNDIVQGSFLEHYKNLTYKHVMAFKYAIYHCPKAPYILKTDDDVFVNMPLMVYILQKDFLTGEASKMLVCAVMKLNHAIRKESKWKVTYEEYPDKLYPTHCSGFAILYSSYVLFQLYKEAQHTKYFWIDDAHITGIIAQKANLSHLDITDLMLNQEETSNLDKIRKIFLLSEVNANIVEIQQLWSYVLRKNLYNSILYTFNSTNNYN